MYGDKNYYVQYGCIQTIFYVCNIKLQGPKENILT
jgi:hypothetical protein